ncbi:MAG: hypothetical protein JRE23_09125 [Deltaproteobacteria bacterium]|nr:hypothetical protein [Deltaproteobacteria bacterium]
MNVNSTNNHFPIDKATNNISRSLVTKGGQMENRLMEPNKAVQDKQNQDQKGRRFVNKGVMIDIYA